MNPTNYLIPISKTQELLPQKTPFVMVDSIIHQNNQEAVCSFYIQENNILVQRGFLSEVGLIENMAQSIALQSIYMAYLNSIEKSQMGFIGAIDNLVIYELPKTNSYILTKVKVIQEFGAIRLCQTEVFTESNKKIAEAKLKTATP
ncbi:hypothetical protein [Mesonia sp. K7]|uniref:hypothetical protein n=1 Tax=Mesonia sp. K7 TaxID=2218606 RepID=UPI000DA7FEC5|nr:hypothetical protein [Mesonia sp. K7]PZD76823.1 hypothetical protein DNG35_10735 [Mesonia sp. K7]